MTILMNGKEYTAKVKVILAHPQYSWEDKAERLYMLRLRVSPCHMEVCRLFCLSQGLSEPTHPNHWPAVAGALQRAGLIERTGQWEPSQGPNAHGPRMTPVWKAVTP